MKTKTQQVQAIVVLWKNATTAVGREEPLSPVERAEIVERVKALNIGELGGFGDEADAPPDEDDDGEEEIRTTTETHAEIFRENLLADLAELAEDDLAASLIATLQDEENRENLRFVFVERVTERGRFDTARVLADQYFREDPSRLLGLRAEIFRRDAKPDELPVLREIAARAIAQGSAFPPSAVSAALTLWSLSNVQADLEMARALSREIKHPMLRIMAYQRIAGKTGLFADYFVGFRYARMATGRQGDQLAEKMFSEVIRARICDVNKEFGGLAFKGTVPMSRETLQALLTELKAISSRWEQVLRRRLQATELL